MARTITKKDPKGWAGPDPKDPIAVLVVALHAAHVGCRASRCVMAEHEQDATRLALALAYPAAEPPSRR